MEVPLVSNSKWLALLKDLRCQSPRLSSYQKFWVRIRRDLFWQKFQFELILSLALLGTSHLFAIQKNLRGLADWQELGLALGMEYSLLDSIDRDKGGDVEKCKTAMLHSWLETGAATKSSLVDALTDMDEDSLAAKFQWGWTLPSVTFILVGSPHSDT